MFPPSLARTGRLVHPECSACSPGVGLALGRAGRRGLVPGFGDHCIGNWSTFHWPLRSLASRARIISPGTVSVRSLVPPAYQKYSFSLKA